MITEDHVIVFFFIDKKLAKINTNKKSENNTKKKKTMWQKGIFSKNILVIVVILLNILSFTSCFIQQQTVSQFLDSQPHSQVRVDFDLTQRTSTDGALITVNLIADLGYYFVSEGNTQQRYQDDASYLRNVDISMKSPSGRININFGKFFNDNTFDNGANYLIDSFFYTTDFEGYYNNPNDIGYYNTMMVLLFSVDEKVWESVVGEGQVSFYFTFSSQVNSYYKFYPSSKAFPFYPENYLAVTVSY